MYCTSTTHLYVALLKLITFILALKLIINVVINENECITVLYRDLQLQSIHVMLSVPANMEFMDLFTETLQYVYMYTYIHTSLPICVYNFTRRPGQTYLSCVLVNIDQLPKAYMLYRSMATWLPYYSWTRGIVMMNTYIIKPVRQNITRCQGNGYKSMYMYM